MSQLKNRGTDSQAWIAVGMLIKLYVVAGRVRSGSTGSLHRQSFASIQLPSISGPINEGLEGRKGRGQRGWGGATARCRRRHRMGIKRARAVIRKEFQPSGNKSGGGGWGWRVLRGGWLGVQLVIHCINIPIKSSTWLTLFI